MWGAPKKMNSPLRVHLKEKSKFLQVIRQHFLKSGAIEVQTPHLSNATGTDLHIVPWTLQDQFAKQWFLHTSPEFAMKRYLVSGSGDIYQICQVFRDEQPSHWHRSEFSMLEWYRVAWSWHELLHEVHELLQKLGADSHLQCYSVQHACEIWANWHPWQDQAIDQAKQKWPDGPGGDDLATWIDYVLVTCVEPALRLRPLVCLYDYPTTHAALSRIEANAQGLQVARRFEFYWHGVEVANGFQELTDAEEQQRRFEEELQARAAQNMPCWPIDEGFLSALCQGLPDCSGVAMGLDRIWALSQGHSSLAPTLA